MKIQKSGPLQGTVQVPGDKSISHRAVMFGSIAEGVTKVRGFLKSADCLATIDCFRRMGIEIEEGFEKGAEVLRIHGKGLHGLTAPDGPLDAKNSGTTTRLISGILAGQPFDTTIIGDASLSRRPMGRIEVPLERMNAWITSTEGHLPMTIHGGGHLRGIDYESEVASAQVKSCLALAGLYAEGETRIIEPTLSRNHTELLLRAFGANIFSGHDYLATWMEEAHERAYGGKETWTLRRSGDGEQANPGNTDFTNGKTEAAEFHGSIAIEQGTTNSQGFAASDLEPTEPWLVTAARSAVRRAETHRILFGQEFPRMNHKPICVVHPGNTLHALDITVPGDISSAAYFLVAANLVPGSELLLKNVGVNPTRAGILAVLLGMGGSVTEENHSLVGGEPVADLRVRFAPLHGTIIGGKLIPTLIDELPVIAVLAAFAEGDTIIFDASELRVKESDRLALIIENLRALGVLVDELPDGMVIHGNAGHPFHSAVIDPHADHRLAMAFAVAGLASDDGIQILDDACVAVSYPDFFPALAAVGAELS